MSNTIDNKEVLNSMNLLDFYWVACFKNDELIFQFTDNKENRFQIVKDRFSELKYFCLYHKNSKLYFLVDLEQGNISFMDYSNRENAEKKYNIRLIYFRRHNIEIFNNESKHRIRYFLGYQYNDNNGINYRTILEINSDGSFIIGS